ncbi:MAG: ParA family protein [Actinomycetota bacterium]
MVDIARAARSFVLTNQKGGVGKTTTAINLGACLAEKGLRVLIVDVDPQGNASTGLGIDRSKVKLGTYEVLLGAPAVEALTLCGAHGLAVIPSTIDLAGAEVELVSAFAREGKLRLSLDPIKQEFDAILIDSPPSLGLLTINALVAADFAIVPIQCEYYALEGLGQLVRTIDLIRDSLNSTLSIGGVVLTMFDPRTKLADQVVTDVRNHFPNTVFDSVIPRSVRLSEAPGFGKSILDYDSSGRGADSYRKLASEVLARWFDRGGDSNVDARTARERLASP